MKKYLTWLLAILVLSFSGCSKETAAQEDSLQGTKTPQKLNFEGVYKVSYFTQGNVDYSEEFKGLRLIFIKDGLLIAQMPSSEWKGSWYFDEKTAMLSIRIVADHAVSLISSDVWEVADQNPAEVILQAKHFEISKTMHLSGAEITADKQLEK